jgi:hypothetical protein
MDFHRACYTKITIVIVVVELYLYSTLGILIKFAIW